MKEKPLESLYSFYNITGICAILVFIYACLYLSSINNTLWFDGAYSLAMINHSWSEIIEITGKDFHPPLYYFIAKIGQILFGNDIFTMRMISVFPILLLFLFTRQFLLKYFGHYSFLLFSLAFLASSPVVLYAVEIRMYSYAMLFVTMTFISAFNAVKTNSNVWYILLFFFFLATFYTQYYAGILVGIGFILLAAYTFKFNRRRFKTILIIALFSFLLYLPWLSVLLNQFSSASDDFVLQSFQYSEILTYGISFFKSGNLLTTFVLFGLFLVAFISFLTKTKKSFADYFFFCGLVSIAIMVAFGVLLSVTIRPLFMPRYLVPACGLVWLFFSTQISINFKSIGVRNLFLISLLLLAANLFLTLSKQPREQGYTDFQNVLSERIMKDDIIIIPEPEASGLLIGVTAHLFPGHKMAITENKANLAENHTLNYHVGPFDMDIIRYEDLSNYPQNKKWLMIPYNAKDKKPEKFALGHSIKYLGNFWWLGFQSGNQFDLYEISPQN
jgi:hypothetical protein